MDNKKKLNGLTAAKGSKKNFTRLVNDFKMNNNNSFLKL